ncbi:MAG: outer membrane beta-barrel protein [Bacteroidales bacterium]|nr:outer membrane beta-barrel protein [Bacteroidales bacterium]
MKKLILISLLIITVVSFSYKAKAQFDYIGGGILLATSGEYKVNESSYYNKPFGINLRASYDYSKKLKIVPAFNFYLPNKENIITRESKTTVFAFNLNAHYILNSRSRDNYKLYVLAGAHVGAWSIKDEYIESFGDNASRNISEFKIAPGANIGGGMQFHLGNRTLFFAEVKYVIAKTNQLVFNPGILYEF